MIPMEDASAAFKFIKGFEEVDEDVIGQDMLEDDSNELEVLDVVRNDFKADHGLSDKQLEQIEELNSMSEDKIDEEEQLDEEEDISIDFEKVQVLRNVDSESEKSRIDEKDFEEDVLIEKIIEKQQGLNKKKHDFCLEHLEISESEDNDNRSPIQIEISDSPMARCSKSQNNVELLMIYPPPPSHGGITVTTEDYKCLEENTYINDIIIDFYLKYVSLEMLSLLDRERTHIFSSHFFTRLSRSHKEHTSDAKAIVAEQRHAGVQRWTKNINIFEKDFIIVPINRNSHWFLAIICFAHLVDNQFEASFCHTSRPTTVQRPCILIFDSLGSKDEISVVNILREYLSIEYRKKMHKEVTFSRKTLKTMYVEVPRQTNATDCGLYVLQYMECFFKNPIQDFSAPFVDLSNWFEDFVIKQKRKNIAKLITDFAILFNKDKSINVPKIKFSKYSEITLSDNEDDSELRESSFPLHNNQYANVTIRNYDKYSLNSTSRTAHSPICFKDSKPEISPPPDTQTSFFNKTFSSSKFYSSVDSDSRKIQPIPKAAMRRTKIQNEAKKIRNEIKIDDTKFYKKNSVRHVSLIKSPTSNTPNKHKVYGPSSAWIYKSSSNNSLENYSTRQDVLLKRIYDYSIENVDSPTQSNRQRQRTRSLSKMLKKRKSSRTMDSKECTLSDDNSTNKTIYLNKSMRVKNPRVTPIKRNQNNDQTRILIVPDVGYKTLFTVYLLKNADYAVHDILSTLEPKIKGEIESTYETQNCIESIEYIVQVVTKPNCSNDSVDTSSEKNRIETIDLVKERNPEIPLFCGEQKENKSKKKQLTDLHQLTLHLRRNTQIILMYPLPARKGSITITTDDFKCLNKNEYLNDTIVDFYLKYLHLELLLTKDQERVYIFNTYFYTRLSRPSDKVIKRESLTEINYAVVNRWTKDVNIFEKDFVIVPVNQKSHWFLVIICYLRLIGSFSKRSFSDLPKESQYPCILILDSLPTLMSIKRSVIVQDLKNYLRCEYTAKMGPSTVFTENDIVVFYPDIPYQLNTTDCGIYALQYMESFCKDFIIPDKLDFNFIATARNWFDQELITNKREEIKQLIIRLAISFGRT